MPKISAIIATHNRSQMLVRAIDSALGQTHNDFELIVVDDCSQDDTSDVVTGYLGDARVTYLRNDTNMGNAATYNRGIAKARGEYLAFLDDDDEWLPDALDKLSTTMDNEPPEVGLIYGWFNNFTGNKLTRIGRRVNDDSANAEYLGALAFVVPTPTSTYLARACAVRNIGGFDEKYIRNTDTRFVRDLILRGYRVRHVPYVTMIKHNDGYQKTSKNKRNMIGLRDSVLGHTEELASELKEYPYLHAIVLLWLTNREFAHGDWRCIGRIISIFRKRPRFVLRTLLGSFRSRIYYQRIVNRRKNIGVSPLPCIWLTGPDKYSKMFVALTLRQRIDCQIVGEDQNQDVSKTINDARALSDAGTMPVVICNSAPNSRYAARDAFSNGLLIEINVNACGAGAIMNITDWSNESISEIVRIYQIFMMQGLRRKIICERNDNQ